MAAAHHPFIAKRGLSPCAVAATFPATQVRRRPTWATLPWILVACVAMPIATQHSAEASIPGRTLPSDRVAPAAAVRITFRQLYFPQARKSVAVRALAALTADPESAAASNLADHEVLPSRFDGVTPAYIYELFGKAFAEALQKLPAGRWSGPVRSELGWHVVWVDAASSEKPDAGGGVERSLR